MAVIDDVIISRLLSAKCETITVPAIHWVYPGRQIPDAVPRFARIVWSLDREHQQRSVSGLDYAAHGQITISILIGCSPERMGESWHAPAEVAAAIAAGIGEASLADDATTHRIDLGPAKVEHGLESDTQPAITASQITIIGQVCRVSGSTLASVT